MLRATAFAAMLLLSTAALAHEDHIGPNGGYTKHLGSVSVEVVTEGTLVRVHVRDEQTEAPIDLTGAKCRAVVLAGGKTESVTLALDKAVLVGAAKQPIPADAKVAVSLQIPGRSNVPSGTFDLGRKASLPTGAGR